MRPDENDPNQRPDEQEQNKPEHEKDTKKDIKNGAASAYMILSFFGLVIALPFLLSIGDFVTSGFFLCLVLYPTMMGLSAALPNTTFWSAVGFALVAISGLGMVVFVILGIIF